MGATTSSVRSTDALRTIQSYLRLAFAALLAWLTWGAFHDAYGNVPIVSDVSAGIHEFGQMLFMPFGIPILGMTMVILGGSLTEVAFPLLFVVYLLRKREDGRRRDVFAAMHASGGRRSVCSLPRSTAPTRAPASSCSSTD